MNSLTSGGAARHEVQLPGIPYEPDPSPELRRLLERIVTDRAALYRPDVVQARHALEARTLLPHYEKLCAATGRDGFHTMIKLWLRDLNRGMEFMHDQATMTGLSQAVLTSSGDLPAVVWNEDTLATALRSLKRVSSHGVDSVVRPVGTRLSLTRKALAGMVEIGAKLAEAEASASRKPESQEERDAVLARHRAQMAVVPSSVSLTAGKPIPSNVASGIRPA